jgi:rhodanese-related sulfurtransferase
MSKRFSIVLIGLAFLFYVISLANGGQTTLHRSVAPIEAYEMWQENPGKVKIVDCRTTEEYVFVGHAFMAHNIPSHLWTGKWDPKEKRFVLATNPDFEDLIKKKFALDDTILIMCRSGGRSDEAVDRLTKAGFTNVYNIMNGFEGDKVTDAESYYKGKRVKNGWKNSGAPWTYKLNPRLIYSSNR